MNVREQLKAYYDNELTPGQAEEVRHLLDGDPSLAAEYEEIANVSQYLRSNELQPTPYGLESTLTALTSRKRRRQVNPILQFAFAGVLVMVIAAVFFPVFAQSKASAKRTQFAEMAKMVTGAAPAMPAENAAVFRARHVDPRSMNGVPMDAMKSQPQASSNSSAGFRDQGVDAPALPSPSASNPNTLVVKTGQMQLQVASVDDAQQQVEAITRGSGGFVESANRNDAAGLANVSMTLRVPVVRFERVLRDVRALGKVLTQSFSGEDVTAQVVDTDARLKVLRAEEQQYITLMSRAGKIGEVLAVKERITQVREQIETLDAQQRSARDQARMSTLSLEISQKPKPKPVTPPVKHAQRTWSENAWARALIRLGGVGAGLGTIGIYLLVFSPIWLPLSLAGWMAYRKYRV